MAQLGVGIIGVGVLGNHHARSIAHSIPRAKLVAVADAYQQARESAASAFDVAHQFDNADDLAGHPDVDAIVIASSDDAHIDGILAAAKHGKDVFCEKPITTNLQDADRAIAAVADAGVRLQIGFMRQYDPAYVNAKKHIDAGDIGTPAFFKNTHRGKLPVLEQARPVDEPFDTSYFINSNIHDYNDARWLLGHEAVEVSATGSRILASTNPDGIEFGVTTIRFRNGALADIETVSAGRYGYDVRIEVVGDLGTLFVGATDATDCVLATEHGIRRDAMDHWLPRFGETYRIELADWVDRMLEGRPPLVTGEDGRAALEIAIAAQESFRTGRRIALPLRPVS